MTIIDNFNILLFFSSHLFILIYNMYMLTKAYFTLEQIQHYPFHIKKDMRLLYIVKGKLIMNHISGQTILNENDIECININEPIELIGNDDNEVLILTVSSDYIYSNFKNSTTATYNINSAHFYPYNQRNQSIENIQNIHQLTSLLKDLYKNYQFNNHINHECLYDLMDLIANHFNDASKHLYCFPNVNEEIIERFIRMEKYIIEHLSEKISLNSLTAIEHLSPQYISSEFRNKYNLTFTNILEYYRIRKAVILILENKEKITHIVKECGFSDNKYFYRAFKKHMKCTPTEFKNKFLSNSVILTKQLMLHDLNSYEKNITQFIKQYHLIEKEKGFYEGNIRSIHKIPTYYCLITNEYNGTIEINENECWIYHSGKKCTVNNAHFNCFESAPLEINKNSIITIVVDDYCFFSRMVIK